MFTEEHSLRFKACATILNGSTLAEGHSEGGVKNILFLSSEDERQLSYSGRSKVVFEVDCFHQLLDLHLCRGCNFDANSRCNHQGIL